MTADTRIWKYRRDENGEIEPTLFAHPDDVPANEGWNDRTNLPAPKPKKTKQEKNDGESAKTEA